MIRQIAIFGLNGSGKSTLGHALARETGLFEMDAEDYYFPEQKASRHWALEHTEIMNTEYLGDLPFSVARSGEEAQTAVLADLDAHDGFILSGVTLNWCQEILSRIRIAFRVQTPAEERIRRIQR